MTAAEVSRRHVGNLLEKIGLGSLVLIHFFSSTRPAFPTERGAFGWMAQELLGPGISRTCREHQG
jgi:hypothetical protein